jgi:hypothetical protein
MRRSRTCLKASADSSCLSARHPCNRAYTSTWWQAYAQTRSYIVLLCTYEPVLGCRVRSADAVAVHNQQLHTHRSCVRVCKEDLLPTLVCNRSRLVFI